MQKIKFNISHGVDGTFSGFKEVEGIVAFEMFGYTWMAHEVTEKTNLGDFNAWEISELSSGRRVEFAVPCLDLEEAIKRAKVYITEKGEKLTHQVVAMAKEQQLNAVAK